MKHKILIITILLIAGILITSSPATAETSPDIPETDQPVRVVVVKGAIFSSTVHFIKRGIKQAEEEGAICILQLDTPGGLVSSMREIIQDISAAKVPVVVFVYPQGGMATSAGTYITYAAHVAAMAPGTHIGSAHPVAIGYDTKRRKPEKNEEIFNIPIPSPTREEKETEEKTPTNNKDTKSDTDKSTPKKISPSPTQKTPEEESGEEVDVGMEKATNAMVALIRALAEKNGRNADWGEKAVRESVSVTANEAHKLGVVEILADDIPDLLAKLKGRKVTLASKKVVQLNPSQDIRYTHMTGIERFLLMLNDPQIAIILMLLGTLGIYYELANPGAAIPGIIGGICLILALFTLGSLPINYTALALILLSVILFIAEALTPTFGALTVGGVIAFVLGAIFLIPSGIPFLHISRTLIVILGLIMGGIGFLILSILTNTLKAKPMTGKEAMIGKKAEVKAELSPRGMVQVDGELWKAQTAGDVIAVGKTVIIEKVEGLLLTVREDTDNTTSG